MSMVEIFGQYMTASEAEDLISEDARSLITALREQVAELQQDNGLLKIAYEQCGERLRQCEEANTELQRQLETAQDYRDKATKTRDEMTDKYFSEKDRADGLQMLLQRERDEAAGQEPVGEVVTEPFGDNDICALKWAEHYDPAKGDKLYAEPVNLPALIEQAKAEEMERVGKMIHYPECWDTSAYPTLGDALTEINHCTVCENPEAHGYPKDWKQQREAIRVRKP